MMQPNWDPYDLLVQLDVRCQLLEQHCRELQANQLQYSEIVKEQNKLIRQFQRETASLNQFVGQLAQRI
jgi:hypothetical protein